MHDRRPKRLVLFDFNAATFTASNRRLWSQTGFYEDYIWSAVDPNVFYFRKFGTERMLHSYNVATGVTTLVRDFTADLGGGYPVQWSRSIDDDVFAFTQQNSSSQAIGYQVWKRSTNTFLLQQAESNIDEVQIDKSGRYLVAKAAGVKVWDLQTGGMTQLYTNSSPWDGFAHSDVGQGTLVSIRSSALPGLGISYRGLSTPQTVPTILALTSWDQRNNHYSMLADDEGWALVTNEGPDTPLAVPNVTVPLQYELYQVATDGSGKVGGSSITTAAISTTTATPSAISAAMGSSLPGPAIGATATGAPTSTSPRFHRRPVARHSLLRLTPKPLQLPPRLPPPLSPLRRSTSPGPPRLITWVSLDTRCIALVC